LSRILLTFVLLSVPVSGILATGCGGESPAPEPQPVMDRALTPESLETALPAATVAVQSLAADDSVLQQQVLRVPGPVLNRLRHGLGRSGQGFAGLVRELAWRGRPEVDGVATDHITGRLDPHALAQAARRVAGRDGFSRGLSTDTLGEGVAEARFDLYADRSDGGLERLDLTLALDHPDNASPPTRIRFSLTGESPSPTP